MDVVLHGVEGARAYLDDLKASGASWQACWEITIRALRALTRVGFKVNLRKCYLPVHSCVLLGCIVGALQMGLGDKYLRRMVNIPSPLCGGSCNHCWED